MNAGTYTVSDREMQALRERHPADPDQSWVAEMARAEGWEAANIRYLESERWRAAEAMRDLLAVLGIEGPRDPAEALDLIELAFHVFAPDSGFRGLLRRGPGFEMYVQNAHCPTDELMEAQGWHGVTACASWHRRRGWFDALGIDASDSVYSEKRWGAPACSALLRIRMMSPLAGQG